METLKGSVIKAEVKMEELIVCSSVWNSFPRKVSFLSRTRHAIEGKFRHILTTLVILLTMRMRSDKMATIGISRTMVEAL